MKKADDEPKEPPSEQTENQTVSPRPYILPPPATISPDKATNFQLLRRMLYFLLPVKGIVLISGALVVVWVIIEVSATRMNGDIISKVQHDFASGTVQPESFSQSLGQEPMASTLHMIIILGLLILLNAICNFGRQVANSKFTMDMVFQMRAAVYDCLQRVGFQFHDAHSSGALINRALSDLQNVRAFLQTSLLLMIEIAGFTFGYFAMLLSVSKWLALAVLVPVPLWIFYVRRFSKTMQPAQQEQMKAGDDVVTVFTEAVAGVHVVKAFATESTEISKYNNATDTWFNKVMSSVKLWSNFLPIIRGIATASHLSLFALGAILIVATRGKPGGLEVGVLIMVGSAMGAILSRLQQINIIAEQYQKAIVSARRFFEVLDATPTVPEGASLAALPPGPGAVEFNFVSFGYDPAKPVVRDIAFDVPGGSVVAIVGPTGSGKSTLMQLLARFYDPQAGQVLIDNVDIRKVSLPSLRRNIGFVFQETFLFSDTVANNIRYGNPRATMGEVEAASRIAQAHEFISELPLGYDTMLGERGASLSGGQRQRLAIARAILTNPRILVLDDALAAVDPETEHLISRALELVMVDRTVFIIAHRLSTVKAADLVIVLEDGRITQAGTHKELLRQEGHYRHIAEVQLAFQEAELMAKTAKKADIAARRQ